MKRYGGQEEGGGGLQESKDICWVKLYFDFLKIGSKPINIAYPLPLTSFLAFSLSKSGLFEFMFSYIFCFFFFTAANLWNHVNDAENDARDGRKDAIFLIKMRKESTFFSIILYSLSALMLLFSKHSISIPLFVICALMTWIYSDKLFFGKKFRRLKEDYKTELLTYLIVTPSFPALLWTFFAPISITTALFSSISASIYLSGIVLKDLKDITADSLAGYKTLAVKFSPKALFKLSVLIMISTIFFIAIASLIGLFPSRAFFTISMLIPIFYSISYIKKYDWELSLRTLKAIKVYTFSFPATLILLAILSLEV